MSGIARFDIDLFRDVSMRIALNTLVCAALLVLAHGSVAAAEQKSADAQRKKPLQRCDQLSGDGQLDCLQKARERIAEARKKREANDASIKRSNGSAPEKAPSK